MATSNADSDKSTAPFPTSATASTSAGGTGAARGSAGGTGSGGASGSGTSTGAGSSSAGGMGGSSGSGSTGSNSSATGSNDASGALAADGSQLLDRVVQSAHAGIDSLAETVAPRIQSLQDGVATARDTGEEWIDSLRCTVRENPLGAVAAAAVLGMLVARLTR